MDFNQLVPHLEKSTPLPSGETISAVVRALDYECCSFSNELGEQCDRFVRVTPASVRLCTLHSPNYKPDPDTLKAQYIELINSTRHQVSHMTWEETEKHIASLQVRMEEIKAIVLTSKAIQADRLDSMTAEEQQRRRRVKLTIGNPITGTPSGISGFSKVASEKETTINKIIREHKKSALEADQIYKFMKTSKMSIEECIALMED